MRPLDLLWHVANFVAPALVVGVLLALGGRFFASKGRLAQVLPTHAAINSIVGVGVLVAGLAVFGRDGKMATYGALVLAGATSQWLLQRGWQR